MLDARFFEDDASDDVYRLVNVLGADCSAVYETLLGVRSSFLSV